MSFSFSDEENIMRMMEKCIKAYKNRNINEVLNEKKQIWMPDMQKRRSADPSVNPFLTPKIKRLARDYFDPETNMVRDDNDVNEIIDYLFYLFFFQIVRLSDDFKSEQILSRLSTPFYDLFIGSDWKA